MRHYPQRRWNQTPAGLMLPGTQTIVTHPRQDQPHQLQVN